MPVLEIDPDALHFDVAEVRSLLDAQPGIQLIYDPALLILRRVQDPVTYWQALRRRIALVDLHDYQIGQSFRPIGHGDCGWERVRQELLKAKDLWLLLEPGLGRLYGSVGTRAQTFAMAIEALGAFWEGR
jgi:sugar phosphate isomerase/epimerase